MTGRVEAAVYEFGPFELDQRTFELRRKGEPVRLERLSHDFLVYLIRHRDRVVPTPELLRQLWPDAVVTSRVVARSVYVAREALDDDARRPKWIATLRSRGYRFVGEVSEPLCELSADAPRDADATRTLTRLSCDRYARALELLDAGNTAALRRELLIGLEQSLRRWASEVSLRVS